SAGPIGPAPGEVQRSRREGDRNQGGHPGSGGTSGSDERSGERGRDGFGGTADSEGDDRSGVLADREPFRPDGDAAEGPRIPNLGVRGEARRRHKPGANAGDRTPTSQ